MDSVATVKSLINVVKTYYVDIQLIFVHFCVAESTRNSSTLCVIRFTSQIV